MFSRLGKCPQFLADESEIVVCIGKVGVQTEGQPELLARSFDITDLIEHTAQIEVSQSAVGIESNRALEVLGSPCEISVFIVEGSAIERETADDSLVRLPRGLRQSRSG